MKWHTYAEIALVSLITTALIFRVAAVRGVVVGQ